MRESSSNRSQLWLAFGVVLLGVAARLLPHPPNLTPLTALALFTGSYFFSGWSLALPVAAVALIDAVIGFHDVVAFTWGGFLLTGMIGWRLGRFPSARRVLGASVLGSVLFFLLTNFGVWWLGDGGTMYPKTAQGLWDCYVAALPFFRTSFLGDVIYTAAIFGLYALLARPKPVMVTYPAPSHRA